MIHHNASKKDLSFELAGKHYRVPVGAEVDIPDHIAYCVKKRGLPLTEWENGGKRVTALKPLRALAAPPADPDVPAVSKAEAAEELADVTGEDPPEEDDQPQGGDDPDDESEATDAAKRTAEQLARQGIKLPGVRR